MQCQRCNGEMINERFYGPGEPFSGWRCVRCGEIHDPIILENRNHCTILAEGWNKGTPKEKKGEEGTPQSQHGSEDLYISWPAGPTMKMNETTMSERKSDPFPSRD